MLNTPHPFFFKSLMREFHQDHHIYITARDRSETVALAKELGMIPKTMGRDFSNRTIKTFNHALRTLQLFFRVPKFDVALALGGAASVAVAKMRLTSSLVFVDNDLIFFQRTLAGSLETKVIARANYIIVPSAFPVQALIKEGARKENIYQFDGYKEDVYIADFKPNPDFLQDLPFDEFVVLRPEALFAAYVTESKSIVPQCLRALVNAGINVVYLPRIKGDLQYMKDLEGTNVFIPQQALNGLDLCWHADVVLTGSGTFAREAACLGTPAVSFFPERLLAVDQQLVREGKMFHSRDVDEVVEHVLSAKSRTDKKLGLERSKKVKQRLVSITNQILGNIAEKVSVMEGI